MENSLFHIFMNFRYFSQGPQNSANLKSRGNQINALFSKVVIVFIDQLYRNIGMYVKCNKRCEY